MIFQKSKSVACVYVTRPILSFHVAIPSTRLVSFNVLEENMSVYCVEERSSVVLSYTARIVLKDI